MRGTLIGTVLCGLLWALPAVSQTIPDYNRKDYSHWIDADRDGENTRHEVLREEDIGILLRFWRCPFTGEVISRARTLDVDHLVPLKEAHISGAWEWSKKKKTAYANYLDDSDHLLAVAAKANRSKGARDPANWLPEKNKCAYAIAWVRVKKKWELQFDDAEIAALLDAIGECPVQYKS